jgi:3-hydroxybutyryl-CoA dehydrogenase
VEDLSKKKLLLKDLSKTLSPSCIIASNTSSLSISELSKSIDYPERFIGLHFLNPATSINLVEIIKGDKTSALTCSVVKEFAIKLGKTPILLKDSPGFLINRMLIPAINEAAFILEAGIASKEEIDLSMKLGAKHPLGPFELADLIGIDVCLSIMESLYKQFNDPKYRPCPLLIRMVNMNQLGRKNKKGFYTY